MCFQLDRVVPGGNVVLPIIAYLLLVASPFAAPTHEREAVFAVGGASLLLLFAGIHNSWDTVSYHVFTMSPKAQAERERPGDAGD
jgi:hypothetical protein